MSRLLSWLEKAADKTMSQFRELLAISLRALGHLAVLCGALGLWISFEPAVAFKLRPGIAWFASALLGQGSPFSLLLLGLLSIAMGSLVERVFRLEGVADILADVEMRRYRMEKAKADLPKADPT